MELKDTAAIITGAASGLGAATAHGLAAKGCRVFGLDLPAAIARAAPIGGVEYVGADVTDAAQVEEAVARAAEADFPLRVAVNCAGVAPSARVLGRERRHDPAVFASAVKINLIGTFLVMTTAAEQIAKCEPDADGQRGVIVNTSSIAAFEGQVGQIAYAASKGGVVSMTLPAARDLASFGIRVCSIAPGIIDTPMMAGFGDAIRANLAAGVPFPSRLGSPEEFAHLVRMIIELDYLNGETIRMDGALRMAPR